MPKQAGSVTIHVLHPHKAGRGATAARGATFRKLTHHAGIQVPSEQATDILGSGAKASYQHYDSQAQGWIARALAEPRVTMKINNRSVGTGAELVCAGLLLSRGFQIPQTFVFQDTRVFLDDYHLHVHKVFVVDEWCYAGRNYYLNIDGAAYHTRTELQAFRDAIRDKGLGAYGTVIDIPDTACYVGASLVSFLAAKGFPL